MLAGVHQGCVVTLDIAGARLKRARIGDPEIAILLVLLLLGAWPVVKAY